MVETAADASYKRERGDASLESRAGTDNEDALDGVVETLFLSDCSPTRNLIKRQNIMLMCPCISFLSTK